jgi:pantoate--beta-alanine ligase
MREALLNGASDIDALQTLAHDFLKTRGWQVDYIAIRRQRDLLPPTSLEVASGERLVILAAAKLGQTRLIDNLEV